MAIQPIAATLAAESHYNESSGYLRSWSAAGPYSVFSLEAISPDYNKKYIAGISFNGPISETITAAAITVKFTKNGTAFGQIKCSVITGDLNSPTVLSTQTFTPSAGSLTHTFSFSGLQVPNGSIRFMFETTTGSNISYQFYGDDASATVTYGNLEDLTIQINPSSFYSGDSAVATIGNSRSRTLTAALTGNGYSLSGGVRYSGSKIIIESTTYWFTQAHVSSGNLPITVTVSDDLGRSVSGSATMLRRIPGTFTPTSPKDAQVNGGQKIQFKWNYSGQGTLKKSELQFSDDGTTWGETIEVTNGEKTYNVDAATLMPGTHYWRGKGFDDISGESPWSAAAEFEVYYNAVSQVVPSSSPTDGNISNYGPISFSVALESTEPVPFDFLIDSAAFYWRSGTSGNYTQLVMTPSTGKETATVDIAAGTFPNGTLQWYATATDEDGNTSQTGVYTLTVVNSSIASFPVSPIDTIQSGTAPVLFIWSYLTLDGSAQNGAELEYSTNTLAWVPFAGRSEITGDMTSYTAPAGTFPGGVVYWHVRSYTQGNTPGPWSQPARFNVFAAPTVSAVVASPVPFTTITWQTEGQVSYELMVDDKNIGPYFGADVRSYKLTEPLEDGLHTVRVRAQNKYGIWSEWAEAKMSVKGTGIVIPIEGYSGKEPYSAYLDIIDYMLPFSYFMIYRDGKYIGKTTSEFFIDRFTTGIHTYQVFQALPDGDVTRSNKITINVRQNCPVIAPLAGGEFIELCLSTDADRAQDIQHSREVVHVHYSGSRFPSSEIGEAETMSVSFDVAWKQTDKAAADAFEALIGEDVILKTPGGYVIVGTLEGYELHDERFDKSYRCTLQQGDWRDFVNVKP